jgi:Rrf2 family cysteine metabolism transcriptional repressor
MRLTTKMRYGTRAMLELALHYDEGLLSSKDIAERQQISLKYLEHLLTVLRDAGLVRSVRGAQGGHTLARPPDQINLRQVLDSLEGAGGLVECLTDPSYCARSDTCVTREVWAEMQAAGLAVLEKTTLDKLARHAGEKADGQE